MDCIQTMSSALRRLLVHFVLVNLASPQVTTSYQVTSPYCSFAGTFQHIPTKTTNQAFAHDFSEKQTPDFLDEEDTWFYRDLGDFIGNWLNEQVETTSPSKSAKTCNSDSGLDPNSISSSDIQPSTYELDRVVLTSTKDAVKPTTEIVNPFGVPARKDSWDCRPINVTPTSQILETAQLSELLLAKDEHTEHNYNKLIPSAAKPVPPLFVKSFVARSLNDNEPGSSSFSSAGFIDGEAGPNFPSGNYTDSKADNETLPTRPASIHYDLLSTTKKGEKSREPNKSNSTSFFARMPISGQQSLHQNLISTNFTASLPNYLTKQPKRGKKSSTKFICGKCDISSQNFLSFKNHLASHNKKGIFRCNWPACGIIMQGRNSLSHHYLVHLEDCDLYKCQQCDKKFDCHSHLTTHKKAVHSTTGMADLPQNIIACCSF